MRRYLTALRPVYVPFREAEPDQLHDAWCPATAAKRHPEGQRDDGLTRDGRVTARRERIFRATPIEFQAHSLHFAAETGAEHSVDCLKTADNFPCIPVRHEHSARFLEHLK